jgi:hypothetical protein
MADLIVGFKKPKTVFGNLECVRFSDIVKQVAFNENYEILFQLNIAKKCLVHYLGLCSTIAAAPAICNLQNLNDYLASASRAHAYYCYEPGR